MLLATAGADECLPLHGMLWFFYNKTAGRYWLNVFALYAFTEACIQLLFYYVLNNFGRFPISNLEFHAIMFIFQCVLVWPIWWVAYTVSQKSVRIQIIVNLLFFILYSYFWFGPVQQLIRFFHQQLQAITHNANRLPTPVDYSLSYQLVKHGFRLSWFFLANYFYRYRLEEKQRLELAVANKALQLKLLKWHLNPHFYFETINYLKQQSSVNAVSCAAPILQLSKVMEYVIYESREKLIEVPKEIDFLNDYTALINRQKNQHIKFTVTVTGVYNNLKIAPLMLAGFIDAIVFSNKNALLVENEYVVKLEFSAKTMFFKIDGDFSKCAYNFLQKHDFLHKRLQELYSKKFSYPQPAKDNCIELSLMLDEK